MIDTKSPGMEHIRQMIQPGADSPSTGQGAFTDLPQTWNDPSWNGPKGYSNPNLGNAILDYLNAGHVSRQGGAHWLGRHWTTDPHVAHEFALGEGSRGGGDLSVVLHAQHPLGHGEDPNQTDTGGAWPAEKEVTLLPGSPINVHDIKMADPDKMNWHSQSVANEGVHTASTP